MQSEYERAPKKQGIGWHAAPYLFGSGSHLSGQRQAHDRIARTSAAAWARCVLFERLAAAEAGRKTRTQVCDPCSLHRTTYDVLNAEQFCPLR